MSGDAAVFRTDNTMEQRPSWGDDNRSPERHATRMFIAVYTTAHHEPFPKWHIRFAPRQSASHTSRAGRTMNNKWILRMWGSTVGWRTVPQDGRFRVRFPAVSLESFKPAFSSLGSTQPLTTMSTLAIKCGRRTDDGSAFLVVPNVEVQTECSTLPSPPPSPGVPNLLGKVLPLLFTESIQDGPDRGVVLWTTINFPAMTSENDGNSGSEWLVSASDTPDTKKIC